MDTHKENSFIAKAKAFFSRKEDIKNTIEGAIKSFTSLISEIEKELSAAQSFMGKVAEVRAQLAKDREDFEKAKEKKLAEVAESEKISLEKIVKAKENTQRILSQEEARINEEGAELEKREKKVAETEKRQKQQDLALTEREDKANTSDENMRIAKAILDERKIALDECANQNALDKANIEKDRATLKTKEENIDKKISDLADAVEAAKMDAAKKEDRSKELDDREARLKTDRADIVVREATLETGQTELNNKTIEQANEQDRLDKLSTDLSHKQKNLEGWQFNYDIALSQLKEALNKAKQKGIDVGGINLE